MGRSSGVRTTGVGVRVRYFYLTLHCALGQGHSIQTLPWNSNPDDVQAQMGERERRAGMLEK